MAHPFAVRSAGLEDVLPAASAAPRVELLGALLVEIRDFSLSLTELIELVQGSQFSSNAAVQTLVGLAVDGPRRPGALADEAGMTAGGMTNLLDRLQAAGFVDRTSDEADRRAVVVGLTPRGDEVADRTASAVRLALSLAGDRLRRWRDTIADLGFDVGDSSSNDVTGPLALELVQNLMRIGSELHVRMSTEDTFGVDEPAPGAMLHVLWMAQQCSGLRPRDVARAEHLSPAGATELIDRAERMGFVERVRNVEADGRAVAIEITEHGRRALGASIRAVEPTVEHLGRVLFPT